MSASFRLSVGAMLVLLAGCRANVAPVPAPGAPVPARAGEKTPGEPRNGLEVVGWMRNAHPSRELKSLAFSVQVTEFGPDSAKTGRGRALVALPGRMRLSKLPSTTRSGYVRNGTRYAVFEKGRRVSSATRVDLPMLLAYDVFAQGVDTTISRLDDARVRFGLARPGTFKGANVWIVGAPDGDTTSAQFWVNSDNWLVVRVIQPETGRAPASVEWRFLEYTDVLGVPVPSYIEIYRDGQLHEKQTITEIVANPTVPRIAFDVSRWRDVRAN